MLIVPIKEVLAVLIGSHLCSRGTNTGSDQCTGYGRVQGRLACLSGGAVRGRAHVCKELSLTCSGLVRQGTPDGRSGPPPA